MSSPQLMAEHRAAMTSTSGLPAVTTSAEFKAAGAVPFRPMVKVQIEATVQASVEECLSLVMDIERYAEVDKKIRPVLWHEREENVVRFACRPKLAGLRQPKVVQYAHLTPGERIEIGLMPLPANRLAHAVARFRASFACQQAEGGGTRVIRTLEFQFTPALRWLLEPLFRRRLGPEVREEIRLAKRHLEHQRG